MRRLLAVLLLGVACAAGGAEAPLSLEEVLTQADQPHPDLASAEARLAWARAGVALSESLDDFRLTLEGSLRSGRNALTQDRFAPDHYLRLNGRKTLWDGGRVEAAAQAARLESESQEHELLDARAQRRLALMARFFDVLLTDLEFAADTEFMAVAYVNWDNSKDRLAVGQLSTPGLAELEARYQETRLARNDSLRRAREKRALLANAMNRPGQLPGELADPELRQYDRPLPDFDTLLAALPAGNPKLKALDRQLAASQQRIQAWRDENRPSLEFEAEAAAYSRDSYTRDNLRAGLNLVWPLYQGARVDARQAQEMAQFHLLQANREKLLLDLRQALYETWEEIGHLRDSARPAAQVNATYREWALERARAEYELELKTNLGNSMAETQAAKFRRRAIEYQLALAWERLAALLGVPVDSIKPEEKKS